MPKQPIPSESMINSIFLSGKCMITLLKKMSKTLFQDLGRMWDKLLFSKLAQVL